MELTIINHSNQQRCLQTRRLVLSQLVVEQVEDAASYFHVLVLDQVADDSDELVRVEKADGEILRKQ